PIAITRCGNFYGGGDLNWERLVPGTIRSILRGRRPVIRSAGDRLREYLYIEDAAAGYMRLAECLSQDVNLAGEAFNFSDDTQLTALQLVNRILHLAGSSLEPEIQNCAHHEI